MIRPTEPKTGSKTNRLADLNVFQQNPLNHIRGSRYQCQTSQAPGNRARWHFPPGDSEVSIAKDHKRGRRCLFAGGFFALGWVMENCTFVGGQPLRISARADSVRPTAPPSKTHTHSPPAIAARMLRLIFAMTRGLSNWLNFASERYVMRVAPFARHGKGEDDDREGRWPETRIPPTAPRCCRKREPRRAQGGLATLSGARLKEA